MNKFHEIIVIIVHSDISCFKRMLTHKLHFMNDDWIMPQKILLVLDKQMLLW